MKNKPVITHTEILCYAIKQLHDELKDALAKYNVVCGRDADLANNIRSTFVDPKKEKLDALLTLYKIETGTEYNI